jgi:para-aminobenzoate synthetase
MTGAPKKRSVELLQTLEQNCCRGLYSGVCGYWCAGGGGDFSVIIRSAFRDGRERDGSWYLGAGGAVTALSDPEEEWDEMETKLKSTLQGFV